MKAHWVTLAFTLSALSTSVFADLLKLPELNQTAKFTRTYEQAHMLRHQGQLLKSVELTIFNSNEEDGIQQYSVVLNAITNTGKKVSGMSGHCDELPHSLGLVCSIVDSQGGDILISDGRLPGKIALNIRNQNGKPLSLLDEAYKEFAIPADSENTIYALDIQSNTITCSATDGVTSIEMDLGNPIPEIASIEDGADLNRAYAQKNYAAIKLIDKEGIIATIAAGKGFAYIHDGVLNVGSGYNAETGKLDSLFRFSYNKQTKKGKFTIDGSSYTIKSCKNI